ncbi:hypothetical protein DI005_20020 [Prauserella sp. PE36]|uniref:hypothetical protein n=1 Tax=Prauserella sp. PE36 TaxID=1504709 RepID=UPI000DE4B2F7|nr:hypothetical protein [Prauserella sp. PE36]RBM18083.1 hypothetical protein DI005_20020 [Prauserella sp. PE36]
MATDAAAAGEDAGVVRHLRAVPAPAPESAVEITSEIPAVVDVPADKTADAAAESPGEAPTVADRRAWLTWLATVLRPNSGLYTDRPTSIQEEWRRMRYGGQVADRGPLRAAETAYGAFAVANKTVVKTWEWIVDHPARYATVSALVVLAALFPLTRPLVAAVLFPFAWIYSVLD